MERSAITESIDAVLSEYENAQYARRPRAATYAGRIVEQLVSQAVVRTDEVSDRRFPRTIARVFEYGGDDTQREVMFAEEALHKIQQQWDVEIPIETASTTDKRTVYLGDRRTEYGRASLYYRYYGHTLTKWALDEIHERVKKRGTSTDPYPLLDLNTGIVGWHTLWARQTGYEGGPRFGSAIVPLKHIVHDRPYEQSIEEVDPGVFVSLETAYSRSLNRVRHVGYRN